VKLQAGEYVSLGKVEAEIKTSPLIDNICVYADSTKHFCVALIVANEKALKALATSLGVSGEFETLCGDKKVEKAFMKEISEHATKCRLQRFEIPQKIKLTATVWTPAMGLLTAAFKIKRIDVQKKYQKDIEEMYKA
jgi:long-chain acyl-CoA synthetase